MVSQQEPVVTGDAVVLDVQIAQLPVRALSAIIDVTVVFICYIIGVVLWATTLTQFDPALSAAVLIIFTVLTIVGYPVIFETATRGSSLGKIAMGLRVVSDDGGPERLPPGVVSRAGRRDRNLDVHRRSRGDLQPGVLEGKADRRHLRRDRGDQRTRAAECHRPRRCRRNSRGGRRPCSCPGCAPRRPSWPASSSPAHRNWTHRCATRWPTGSPATSSPGYRHRHLPAHRRSCARRGPRRASPRELVRLQAAPDHSRAQGPRPATRSAAVSRIRRCHRHRRHRRAPVQRTRAPSRRRPEPS